MTISEVREYAQQNYEKGGKIILETYDDSDIQEIIDTYETKREIILAIDSIMMLED